MFVCACLYLQACGSIYGYKHFVCVWLNNLVVIFLLALQKYKLPQIYLLVYNMLRSQILFWDRFSVKDIQLSNLFSSSFFSFFWNSVYFLKILWFRWKGLHSIHLIIQLIYVQFGLCTGNKKINFELVAIKLYKVQKQTTQNEHKLVR